jgi:hypothetical protein
VSERHRADVETGGEAPDGFTFAFHTSPTRRMPQSDPMHSATAFGLAGGRFWKILRPCPQYAASRRPVSRASVVKDSGGQKLGYSYYKRTGRLSLINASDLASNRQITALARLPAMVPAKRRTVFVVLIPTAMLFT